MIDHLRLAFDDVQTTLRTVLSIEDDGVVGPFGGTHPQSLRQTYFGEADNEDYDHITATLNNMPEAIGAASFSCIDEKHDPWGQRDKCYTHVALSQHERNHIVLCPAFLRTGLLGNSSMIGATMEQVHGGDENLAAHVLIHELAHTSAASNQRRIVDWFLMAPLGGEKGKFAYQSSPVQELACMSPRHAVENADNVAWYALSMALALKGAVVERISNWDCRRARHRYEALVDPENFMIPT
ncbi:hypothetical protein PRZ48_012183 [Zasmidium cellare]|uniref:Lysine-specific metallo-endopeptidase domain-containing protein n=1 Tax=Zasmidium cellare TaxID=395010 RepID=A0ABR0E464_ZASCE|nr:hypothetical protein PRZ48_012183 [Zasmidium cellare]